MIVLHYGDFNMQQLHVLLIDLCIFFFFFRILSGDPGMVSYNSSPVESGQNDFAALNVLYEVYSEFYIIFSYLLRCAILIITTR